MIYGEAFRPHSDHSSAIMLLGSSARVIASEILMLNVCHDAAAFRPRLAVSLSSGSNVYMNLI